MTTCDTSPERQAFEEWMAERFPSAPLYRRDAKGSLRFGQYCSSAVEDQWETWKARGAIAAPSASIADTAGARDDAMADFIADFTNGAPTSHEVAAFKKGYDAAATPASSVADPFPYQKTFDAIAAATEVQAGRVAISVIKFREAFGASSVADAVGASEPIYQVRPLGQLKWQDLEKISYEMYSDAELYARRIVFTHPSAEIAALRERIAGMEKDAIRSLIARHAEELEQNDYAYFELAYTRRTGWMAWICSNHRDADPNRKVLARGQGDTPDDACSDAISKEKQG